ncbi:DUF6567 family protein [Methylobacter sp. YRD-M1]|uniref:DUF6567 family protein n=1 Tax=Methylobacter sp. YRD-M1 TaxID=2911520 RepID=UPI00227B0101|nr:DUF6567 family protein [Methylobacter sp. YRD-M1]WAK02879.1 hypothetical protein LZ558_03585 [Methylobacter sp. YRD-M1]
MLTGNLGRCFMMNSMKVMPILWLLTGCAALPSMPALSGLIPAPAGTQILTATSVDLSRKNFKIVRANASGHSVGFSFLGLINLKSPGYDEAVTQLYKSAGITEGKPQALVNVMHEQTSTYFILFALPKISVRADVVEFIGDAAPVSIQDTRNTRQEDVHLK